MKGGEIDLPHPLYLLFACPTKRERESGLSLLRDSKREGRSDKSGEGARGHRTFEVGMRNNWDGSL